MGCDSSFSAAWFAEEDDEKEEGRPMPEIPTCAVCGRERTINDAYDYTPWQAIIGLSFGWYSGDDGEMCSECFTDMMRKANGR